ncbi:MAG: site-specific integrase [Bacteroidaceae bacterium]|nr:site-specific integrase [Bacteroidaceae bacterium]
MKKKETRGVNMIRPSLPSTFLAFASVESALMKSQRHFGIAANYTCAARSFGRFLSSQGSADVSFPHMTPCMMANYEAWLLSQGVCRNTSSCYMRSLHSIYNRAVRQGLAKDNPFADVYTGVARTKKRAVSREVIRRIYHLDIQGELVRMGRDAHRKTFAHVAADIQLTRDLFIFCFCARGLTFVDAAYLKRQNLAGNLLRYTRHKTGQHMEVKIEPMMWEILNRYASNSPFLFPILHATDASTAYRQYRSALRCYNRNLKVLSSMLGGNIQLTSYVCRHSWATTAYQQQVPLSVISQAMGHDSELTTRIYLKSLENSTIDKANHALLKSVFS